jgi:hypothetical protein
LHVECQLPENASVSGFYSLAGGLRRQPLAVR